MTEFPQVFQTFYKKPFSVFIEKLPYFTYVLRMLQPTVVSFHPYPDDQLLLLVPTEYSQPDNRANTKKTQSMEVITNICIVAQATTTIFNARTQLQSEPY
jgi:hypothetical protein